MNQTQQNQGFHPVQSVNDGIFNTATGKLVNLYHPTEDMISLQDISGALSKICRFGGHTTRFYSVAQHSVLVAALCKECPKEALMHDASEAYLGDVIKPLKVMLGAAYKDLEHNFENIIAQKFGLQNNRVVKATIKQYDLKALELEHLAFQQNNPLPLLKTMRDLELITAPLVDPYKDIAWEPSYAQMVFGIKYGELFSND